jgi:uncharacterized repeat protein (TIGR03847 family)
MTEFTYDFQTVHRITASAVGPPGQRTFYVQARQGTHLISLLAEKEQVRALADAVTQLLDELEEKNPLLSTSDDMLIMDMSLEEPLEPDFRISQMGLGYDTDRDMVVLVVRGQISEEDEVMARIAATRPQMRAMSVHAARVVESGRPLCYQYPRPCNYREAREGVCPFCPDMN